VHGYRAQDTRNNLRYSDDGDIVYSSAGVGISYDKATHTQKHYVGHDDDIVSLAVSPDGAFVATGQMGKRPLVHVWDAGTCAEVCVLPRFHKRAITNVTFSPGDGNMIASVGQDDDHSICVWESANGEWTDGKRKAKCKGSKDKIRFVHFTGLDDFDLVSGGDRHVKFFTLCGKNLKSKKGIFGTKGKIQTILCAATVGGKVVTGARDGSLYSWEGRQVSSKTSAHESSVNAMFVTATSYGQDQLITGGKDGQVRIWSSELEPTKTFDLKDLGTAAISTSIRSVCVDVDNTRILVGTYGSEIYEIQTDEEDCSNALQISQGHCKQELWGLAMHPTNEDLYATAGDDKTVRVWSISQKKAVAQSPKLSAGARALAWKPDGSEIAVGMGTGKGTGNGAWAVLTVATCETSGAITLSESASGHEAKEWISDVKYSPDGSQLAVGSRDNKIYLYNGEKYEHKGVKCEAHNSYITHMDYTKDGKAIRSTCGAYELLFHSSESGSQDPSGASKLKDTEWESETCTLGWGVQGIWPEGADGTDINAVHKSNKEDSLLLATSDDSGAVNLYNYPVISRGNSCSSGKGHSSHVTNVRFNASDTHVVTTGGNDRSVLQWKLSNSVPR